MLPQADCASWSAIDARGFDWRGLVEQAIRLVATPCYVGAFTPVAQARSRVGNLASRLPLSSWLSFKTHPLPSLATDWINSGGGIEVVSESELITLLKLGCPVDQLLVNGVAKHSWLQRHNLHRLRVHFDSVAEIDALLETAIACDWRVGVRCHVPGEGDAREPEFGGQFGMSWDEATASLCRLMSSGVNLRSVHFDLGQGRHTGGSYLRATNYLAALCAAARAQPRVLDFGGSLPAPNDSQCDLALEDLHDSIRIAEDLLPCLEESGSKTAAS